MATNDADHEYGPTPEHSTYEHTDIEPTIAGKFAVWLGVAMVVSAGIVYGTFWMFEGWTEEANQAAQQFPLAADYDRPRTGPLLQTQPFKDLWELREKERQKLTQYSWVDQGSGVVRIPVDEAIRLMSERGVPTLGGEPSGGGVEIVPDSASGRTTAPRAGVPARAQTAVRADGTKNE